jgi:hypothetical protein
MKAIKNCPVTTEDMNNAKKILGVNMSSLKGKSTRRKSTPVREDVTEIPEGLILQNCSIDLCIDIMYVNKCGFMTTIDQTIHFRSALPIKNDTDEEYYHVLDMVLRLYNSAGFHIKTIHCNGEFRVMMDKVKDNLGLRMNFMNTLDHVPEAERNNRIIKERVLVAYHRLPYKALPRQLLWYLVQTQASQLNLFPAKGRKSPDYRPRTILGLPALDYAKNCAVPFGAYVQANHETNQTSSNASRTLDAIYLRPVNSMQGGHELYKLNSERAIMRARVTQIRVTDMVIKAIKQSAENQGFKTLSNLTMLIGLREWIMMKTSEDNYDKAYEGKNSKDPEEDIKEDQYYQINKDELEDRNKDARQDPNQHLEQGKIEHDDQDEEETKDEGTAIISGPESDSQASEVSRSMRTSNLYQA